MAAEGITQMVLLYFGMTETTSMYLNFCRPAFTAFYSASRYSTYLSHERAPGFPLRRHPHPQRDLKSGRTRLFNLPCLAMAAGGTMSTSGMAPMGSEMCRCVGADASAAPNRARPGRLSRIFSTGPVRAPNCFTSSLTTSGEALTTTNGCYVESRHIRARQGRSIEGLHPTRSRL